MVNNLSILIATLIPAIDGFGEEHFVKTASLFISALLTIFVGIQVLNAVGWFSLYLPGFFNIHSLFVCWRSNLSFYRNVYVSFLIF